MWLTKNKDCFLIFEPQSDKDIPILFVSLFSLILNPKNVNQQTNC